MGLVRDHRTRIGRIKQRKVGGDGRKGKGEAEKGR